jgi:integrase
MRQFYLHSRHGIIYAQFVDHKTKKCLSAISTKKTNRDEAILVVYDWLKNGIPEKNGGLVRTVQEKLSLAQVLNGLKTVSLTHDDILKIEKILQDQNLIQKIILKDSEKSLGLIDFLLEFWDYEKSPYIREKMHFGFKLGKSRVRLAVTRIKTYWAPYFKDITFADLDRKQIRDFSAYLFSTYSHLANSTIHSIFSAGIQAIRWAYANEYIAEDVTKYLPTFSAKMKERGVLSPEEATTLFSLNWPNKQNFLINLVAMATGLRLGEILALQMNDIGEKYLFITKSYSSIEGLKSTKTDSPRTVPIIPELRDALKEEGNKNPYGNGFIFFGIDSARPLRDGSPREYLQKMLVKMKMLKDACDFEIKKGDSASEKEEKRNAKKEAEKIAVEYWKSRNVVFHSWRHFYASRMRDKLESRKVMLATGHKTEAIFKRYTAHGLEGDLTEVFDTTNEVFGNIIPKSILIKNNSKTA